MMRLQRWLAYYAVLSGEWHSQGLGLLVGLRAPKSLGDSCLIVALIACQNSWMYQGNGVNSISSARLSTAHAHAHARRGLIVSAHSVQMGN